MWRLRDEKPEDHRPIRELNNLVFGRADEPELIDNLRDAGDVVASIVALEARRIIGHILFSELAVEGSTRAVRAAALAPMAVHPSHQRSGIGSALVRRGLDVCGAREIEAVIVLGHPTY
jgi:putative acetyltransferase